MSMVYVRSKEGKVLMPTERCGHVRYLIKTKQARIVELKPFTIQLNYETDDITQRVLYGEDPGHMNIGGTAVREDGKPLLSVYQRLNRIMPGSVFMVNGVRKVMTGSTGLYKGNPQYFKFTDGTQIAPKQCRLIKHNPGIVFV